jgi:hypothetical protein
VAVASGRNFAFIDGQNVNLGIRDLGWRVDWRRFRIHLEEHYRATRAFYFVGFIPDNQALYTRLQKAGHTLVFKPVTYRGNGKTKGFVDAELVLQAMIEYPHYDRAVIVTSDVLSPNRKGCSALLKRAARERLDFLEDARRKIAYKSRRGTPSGRYLRAYPFLVILDARLLVYVGLSRTVVISRARISRAGGQGAISSFGSGDAGDALQLGAGAAQRARRARRQP